MEIEYFCFHLNNCKKILHPKTKQFFFINNDGSSIPVVFVSLVQKKYGPIFTKKNITEFESKFLNGEPKLLSLCKRTNPSLPISVENIADLHRSPINGDASCHVPQHERKIWCENLQQGDFFAYKVEDDRRVELFDKVDRIKDSFLVTKSIFLIHKRFELSISETPLSAFSAVDFHFFRQAKAIELLEPLKVNSLFDFGCGDGQFLKKLNNKVEELSGYDLRKYFVEGVKVYSDEEYRLLKNKSVDCVTLIEVIEHLEESDVSVLMDDLLIKFKPTYLLMSTPVKVEGKNFTHPDHKFEWSTDEFEQFCINKIKGYKIIEFETITNPVSERQTQLILMSRF
jgi:hypothetical protein